MERIYFYLRSLQYSNIEELKLNLKRIEYTLKNVCVVVDEEDKNIVEKYTKNVVTLNEVDGWMIAEYELIPKIKNKDLKIIGFCESKEGFIRKYINAIDYLKSKNFENVVLLPSLRKIVYKEGWWLYWKNRLMKYTNNLEKLLKLVPYPKSLIYFSHLKKIIKFLENTPYAFSIYPLPSLKFGICRIKEDDFILNLMEDLIGFTSSLKIVEIMMYKNYTSVIMTSNVFDFFAIKIIVPTKDIKERLNKIKEEINKIKIIEIDNRTVVYDERDTDKIIELKKLLDPGEE